MIVYRPIPENVAIYDQLYAEYSTLYDYFGRGENDVMKRLRALRRASCRRIVGSQEEALCLNN